MIIEWKATLGRKTVGRKLLLDHKIKTHEQIKEVARVVARDIQDCLAVAVIGKTKTQEFVEQDLLRNKNNN